MTVIIVAYARNRVIGKDNKLPWHLPAEIKHFKDKTAGHPVIMGKNTYLSIVEHLGHGLPNRRNIVVSSSLKSIDGDFELVRSLEDALALANEQLNQEKPVFIIGGAQLYKTALDKDLVDQIYASEIDAEIDGDAWFPPIDESAWREVSVENFTKDSNNQYNFKIRLLERVK